MNVQIAEFTLNKWFCGKTLQPKCVLVVLKNYNYACNNNRYSPPM